MKGWGGSYWDGVGWVMNGWDGVGVGLEGVGSSGS